MTNIIRLTSDPHSVMEQSGLCDYNSSYKYEWRDTTSTTISEEGWFRFQSRQHSN